MPNSFAQEPELPNNDIPPTWTCPITGFVVPKDPDKNLLWRATLLEKADEDEGLQHALKQASSESVLFWLNTFGVMLRIQETDDEGRGLSSINTHIPWVTWPIQDIHIKKIEHAIENSYSLLTDKSRDMGASWNHLGVFHHQWLFRSNSLFLEMSRVKEDVDDAGNPKALMVKHDIINQWLPTWMRPFGCLDNKKYRKYMRLANSENGSRIDGSASGKFSGSGDRRKAVLLDEMAKMDQAKRVKSSLLDVSHCLLANSTPCGPGTTYTKWRYSGQVEVFTLGWWNHPEKANGLYTEKIESTGKWLFRSPWYDREKLRRDPQELAQETDLDHIGSGSTFFDDTILETHRKAFARRPKNTYQIDFNRTVTNDKIPYIIKRSQHKKIITRAGKQLSVWCPLIDGRPSQYTMYTIGIDVSKGQGASNTVMSIRDDNTGEKIAEWADANTPPYEAARIACALALWVGGTGNGSRPLMVWEQNGPGWDFGRQVVKLYKYPNFFKDKPVGNVTEKASQKYGWHSSPQSKAVLLGDYRRSIAHGEYINHSEPALVEAMSYVYYETNSGIGPAGLIAESESARKTHGDRVIADALTLLCRRKVNKSHKVASSIIPPKGSIGRRMYDADNLKKQNAGNRLIDFRQERNLCRH